MQNKGNATDNDESNSGFFSKFEKWNNSKSWSGRVSWIQQDVTFISFGKVHFFSICFLNTTPVTGWQRMSRMKTKGEIYSWVCGIIGFNIRNYSHVRSCEVVRGHFWPKSFTNRLARIDVRLRFGQEFDTLFDIHPRNSTHIDDSPFTWSTRMTAYSWPEIPTQARWLRDECA